MARFIIRNLLRHPSSIFGGLSSLAIIIAITVNVGFLQPGKHPAPLAGTAGRATASVQPIKTRSAPVPKPLSKPAATASLKPVPAPAAKPAPAPDPIAAILLENGPAQDMLLLEVQTELQSLGLYDGPLDGLAGPQTKAAIVRFQERAGLKPTGKVDDTLLARLRDASLPARPVRTVDVRLPSRDIPVVRSDGGPDKADPKIAAVQRVLAEIGYVPGAVDGLMGRETRDAIAAFQADRGMVPSGELTDRLIQELEAFIGKPVV